jgi:hypothetical protein
VDVEVPVGDAVGEVAQGVRRDVDTAGGEPVALQRRERPVVPDDVADRISHPRLGVQRVLEQGLLTALTLARDLDLEAAGGS